MRKRCFQGLVWSVVLLVGLLGTGWFFQVQAQGPVQMIDARQTPVLIVEHGLESPEELFAGATRLAMKALDLLIKTLPQYEPPVVLENGDILIRRKRSEPAPSGRDQGDDADQKRI